MKFKYKIGSYVFFFKAEHIYSGKVDSVHISNSNKDKHADPVVEVSYSVLDGHNSHSFPEDKLFASPEAAQTYQAKNIKGWQAPKKGKADKPGLIPPIIKKDDKK